MLKSQTLYISMLDEIDNKQCIVYAIYMFMNFT